MQQNENPYIPPDQAPEESNSSIKDILVFMFLSIALGFCLGAVFTVWFLNSQ